VPHPQFFLRVGLVTWKRQSFIHRAQFAVS
jgi:hypothetical protein